MTVSDLGRVLNGFLDLVKLSLDIAEMPKIPCAFLRLKCGLVAMETWGFGSRGVLVVMLVSFGLLVVSDDNEG